MQKLNKKRKQSKLKPIIVFMSFMCLLEIAFLIILAEIVGFQLLFSQDKYNKKTNKKRRK